MRYPFSRNFEDYPGSQPKTTFLYYFPHDCSNCCVCCYWTSGIQGKPTLSENENYFARKLRQEASPGSFARKLRQGTSPGSFARELHQKSSQESFARNLQKKATPASFARELQWKALPGSFARKLQKKLRQKLRQKVSPIYYDKLF